MTEKLFMVYLGGSAPGANIELHDIRFVVGETIEATYAQLKRQWFGSKQSVHMGIATWSCTTWMVTVST